MENYKPHVASAQETQPQPAPIPGKETGKFTKAHHIVFRQWMAVLSGEAFKALCCIIDRTWGYEKQEATVSLSVFKRYMGLPTKHDSVVYRALRELFYFRLIGEGEPLPPRGDKTFFVTENLLTTIPTLVVRKSKTYIEISTGANMGFVELLTLRKEIHYPHVSSPTNAPSVDISRLTIYQDAPEDALCKSKHGAKYKSLNTGFKDKIKKDSAPNVAHPLFFEERDQEDERTKGRSANNLMILPEICIGLAASGPHSAISGQPMSCDCSGCRIIWIARLATELFSSHNL